MKTQRFNIPEEWRRNPSMPSNPLFPFNFAYKGLTDLTSELIHIFSDKKSIPKTMIEIGSYMGESTMIFASSGIFETIHSIEPHQGIEIFSEQYQYTWKDIEKEYKINTRHFNNIIHHKDFSYNVLDKFEDNSIDFIYIDADHTYESVKKDIESYLPKLKDGGVIGGHDYQDEWQGVINAVNETIGKPNNTFCDGSWIKQKKNLI